MDDPTLTPSRPLGADKPLLAAHVGANWERCYRPRFDARAAASIDGFRAVATHQRLPRWVRETELSSAPGSGAPAWRNVPRP